MEKKSKIKNLMLIRDPIMKGFCGCMKKPCGGKNKEICPSLKR
jgi:hypothetical protein